MPVNRHKFKRNFTIIPKVLIQDRRLSIEARGALVYMISRSRNWTFRHDHLQKELAVGRDRLRRVLEELITVGYVQRSPYQPRDSDHCFTSYEYCVSDISEAEAAPVPAVEKFLRSDSLRHKSAGAFNQSVPGLPPNQAKTAQDGEVLTDFGQAARAQGMVFVYENSVPYESWRDFRGDDGLPLTDVMKRNGKTYRGIWMISRLPPRRT